MPKFLITYLISILIISCYLVTFASNSRTFDFNNNSDLDNYFNSDGTPTFENRSFGGLRLSGGISTSLGTEEIWTSKKGYFSSPSGAFIISGYYFNLDNFGYGSIGFTNNNTSTGDGRASPGIGIGLVFHGGGGYFVNNGIYTEVLWPPDLEDNKWYYFEFIAQYAGGNNFDLILRVYKADEYGTLLSFKSMETLTVSNPQMTSTPIFYSYFGTADARFTYIDNIKIELSGGPTFEEDGKPAVTTSNVANITKTSADGGGSVENEYGSTVSEKGVCYGTSPSPTTSGVCTSDGTGLGAYTSNISGLNENTIYYYRAFATNLNGVSYGNQKTFTTLSTPASTQPSTQPQNSTNMNPENNTNSNSNPLSVINGNSKPSKKECFKTKPPQVTWINLKSISKGGQKGMLVTWSQLGADRVDIQVDNGSNKYPYVISRTKNDGSEFLPNVNSNQKVRILPYNGCKKGETSIGISLNSNPKGYFNHKK